MATNPPRLSDRQFCAHDEAAQPETAASLNNLPPELLHQIVDSSIPHVFHSETWSFRLSTLASLSLVGRRLRHIALPKLQEILFLRSSDRMAIQRVFAAYSTKEAKLRLHRLIVSDNWSNVLAFGPFKQFLDECENLRSITTHLWSDYESSLPSLEVYRTLSELQLWGRFRFESPVTFATLRTLSITSDCVAAIGQSLDPVTVPSLRALSIGPTSGKVEPQTSEAGNLGTLLPQLEMMSVHVDWFRLAYNSLLSPFVSRILVDVKARGGFNSHVFEVPSTIRHLRLVHVNTSPLENRGARIRNLVRLLRQRETKLNSLYLDMSLHPTRPLSGDLRISLSELEDLCVEIGTSLVYEQHMADPRFDSFISEEFWRRQREQKKKELAMRQ